MKNFEIIPEGDQFRIVPVANNCMAKSLIGHCRYQGNFLCPTEQGAETAVKNMDLAIENRHGRPWLNFKKEAIH